MIVMIARVYCTVDRGPSRRTDSPHLPHHPRINRQPICKIGHTEPTNGSGYRIEDRIADRIRSQRQSAPGMDDVEALEALRGLLLDQQQQRIDADAGRPGNDLNACLAMLEDQVNDDEALVATLNPVMADAISTSIRDSRDDMIEALYPITGRLVSKAVAEAMRDLVRIYRSPDAQYVHFRRNQTAHPCPRQWRLRR